MNYAEAVNYIFNLNGFPSVHSPTAKNRYVAEVGGYIDRVRKRYIRRYFKVFGRKTTLAVNGDGRIPISQYLRVVFPDHLVHRLTKRNGYVWDIEADDYYATEITNAFVVEDTGFDNIDSDSWQEAIAARAAAEFAKGLNDVDANYAEIERMARRLLKQAVNESPTSIGKAFGLGFAMRGYRRSP